MEQEPDSSWASTVSPDQMLAVAVVVPSILHPFTTGFEIVDLCMPSRGRVHLIKVASAWDAQHLPAFRARWAVDSQRVAVATLEDGGGRLWSWQRGLTIHATSTS